MHARRVPAPHQWRAASSATARSYFSCFLGPFAAVFELQGGQTTALAVRLQVFACSRLMFCLVSSPTRLHCVGASGAYWDSFRHLDPRNGSTGKSLLHSIPGLILPAGRYSEFSLSGFGLFGSGNASHIPYSPFLSNIPRGMGPIFNWWSLHITYITYNGTGTSQGANTSYIPISMRLVLSNTLVRHLHHA
ncbi:hypothetical protein MPH_02574 [Macrophomina phaseolina MS6]|uniref:Uncharacterized protein n=1 Tax=Macrophomina phaseolina (strain MS6) TaxID=1126212 RepID=K2SCJ9_MACPH|nr:hypothetical protein MPH_02574 [Macrophomina phaseolina MS6]